MNAIELLTKIPGFGGLIEKAPQALTGFLDKMLADNMEEMQHDQGEEQMFYVMFPDPRTKDYTISIVTATADDKILRSVKSIPLKDALSIIFNSEQHAN